MRKYKSNLFFLKDQELHKNRLFVSTIIEIDSCFINLIVLSTYPDLKDFVKNIKTSTVYQIPTILVDSDFSQTIL